MASATLRGAARAGPTAVAIATSVDGAAHAVTVAFVASTTWAVDGTIVAAVPGVASARLWRAAKIALAVIAAGCGQPACVLVVERARACTARSFAKVSHKRTVSAHAVHKATCTCRRLHGRHARVCIVVPRTTRSGERAGSAIAVGRAVGTAFFAYVKVAFRANLCMV